jgi:UDP-glucose:(heptosyl)LPS alpha-1,3-glucosyltransferase
VKIALVILHADAARGGAERYTLDLANALVKRGHEVSLLASSFADQPFPGKAVTLASAGATRTGRYNSFLDSLDAELTRNAYDIVHAMLPVRQCDVYHPHAGIAGEMITSGHLNKSGLINKAIAWVGNRTNRRRLAFASIEKQLLRTRPTVLCLSELIKHVVRGEYPNLPDDKLVSLFNGTDLCKFDPTTRAEARDEIRDRFSITHDETVALILAQDFERKGLALAIEAVAKVPGIILLVGGKPDPAQYRQLAKSRGVADRVIFAGQVSDPVSFYKAADFFVLPTRFDPCSLVVLEALAMGLPVISTAQNGACEIMQDGIHGKVLANPDDIDALIAAVREMADPTVRSAMSINCLHLRPILSQDAHIDRLERVYQQILSSRMA